MLQPVAQDSALQHSCRTSLARLQMALAKKAAENGALREALSARDTALKQRCGRRLPDPAGHPTVPLQYPLEYPCRRLPYPAGHPTVPLQYPLEYPCRMLPTLRDALSHVSVWSQCTGAASWV